MLCPMRGFDNCENRPGALPECEDRLPRAGTSLRYANGHNERYRKLACARTEKCCRASPGDGSRKNTWSVRDRRTPSSTPTGDSKRSDTFARHFAADNFLGRAHVLRGRVDRVTRFGVDVDFHGRRKHSPSPRASCGNELLRSEARLRCP